jgi:hypothetical protein
MKLIRTPTWSGGMETTFGEKKRDDAQWSRLELSFSCPRQLSRAIGGKKRRAMKLEVNDLNSHQNFNSFYGGKGKQEEKQTQRFPKQTTKSSRGASSSAASHKNLVKRVEKRIH